MTVLTRLGLGCRCSAIFCVGYMRTDFGVLKRSVTASLVVRLLFGYDVTLLFGSNITQPPPNSSRDEPAANSQNSNIDRCRSK